MWKYVVRRGTSSMWYQRLTFIGFKFILLKDVVLPFMVPLAPKKSREATHQVVATLSTTILPLVDMMPHKTKTLPLGEKVIQIVLHA